MCKGLGLKDSAEAPKIRVIDRHGEAWFVVKDIAELLGRKTDKFASWSKIPEMDRDVDRIAYTTENKQWLKIVTMEGLLALLSCVAQSRHKMVLEVAQIALLGVFQLDTNSPQPHALPAEFSASKPQV